MKSVLILLIYLLWCSLSFAQVPSSHDFVLDLCSEDPESVHSLSSITPRHVQDRACSQLGLPAESDDSYLGPNCFVAVMYWFDASQELRFVSGKEFDRFLKDFRPISEEELQFQDLVTFIRKDLSMPDQLWVTHAAVYLGNGYVWNKLGPSKYFDRGDGLRFVEPAWTFSTVAALQEKFDSSTIRFLRQKR